MRVALYARNSKPPRGWRPSFPGEEPPGSWQVQLEALRRRAEAEGAEVTLEAHDANVSGTDPNRAGWQRVVTAARGNQVHEVWAVKVDRVMRSAVHFHRTVEEFLEHGIDLVFTEHGLRISKRDAISKVFVGFLAIMAELEVDLTRERIAAVMRVGEDGRTYGPRSEKPAGRPREFGPGHKLRTRRDGSVAHDRARCRACRGETGGASAQEGG